MLISNYYHIHIAIALGVVAGVLAISIALSLAFPRSKVAPGKGP